MSGFDDDTTGSGLHELLEKTHLFWWDVVHTNLEENLRLMVSPNVRLQDNFGM
jgi:hypothetical protein